VSSNPERKVTGEIPEGARIVETRGADVRDGDALAPLRKVITAVQTAVFSRIAEFVRNTHDDLEIARAGKLPTLIVQGQQQAASSGSILLVPLALRGLLATGSN
jgi:hypothetical protein